MEYRFWYLPSRHLPPLARMIDAAVDDLKDLWMKQIVALQQKSVHSFPSVTSSDGRELDLITAQGALRARVLQTLNWDALIFSTHDGLTIERDKYDMPSTVYLLCIDETKRRLLACLRLNSTLGPYLSNDPFFTERPDFLFPNLALPSGPDVADASRYCIENELSKDEEMEVRTIMQLARAEFKQRCNLSSFLSIFDPKYKKRRFEDHGWNVEPLGKVIHFQDDHEVTGQLMRHWITDAEFQKRLRLHGAGSSILSGWAVNWPN